MKTIMENWRQCLKEEAIPPKELERLIIEEYYRVQHPINAELLEEIKVPDFLKKLALFGAAAVAGTGIGVGAHQAIKKSVEKPPIEQPADFYKKITDMPSYGTKTVDGPVRMPIEKDWQPAPTGGEWVWVPPDQIADHEYTSMSQLSAKDYRTHLMQDSWDIDSLYKLLYGDSGQWAYGPNIAQAFDQHPEGGKMLPLDWSIAYDVYQDKVEDKINSVMSHPEAGTDDLAVEFGEKDWDSFERKLMKLQVTIQK